ncbi:MAG: nucleotide sugar dehydrogenase [Bradyrhizobiaceae bacterium]|nr:nucleotide sugar dehydrogenase [Bradyrhizobiaceae bacterium]
MKISVFGLGYVGSVCAACLADRGHTVIGVDSAASKVDLIRSGRAPIVEPEIGALIQRAVASGRLTATLDSAYAVAHTEMSIVCVGTPSQPNGSLSLAAIEAVSREIGKEIGRKRTRHEVVIRSTVVPGTTREFIIPRLAESSGKKPGDGFGLTFNPEFLREGSSIGDFLNPSKTVVGGIDQVSIAAVMSLYTDLPGAKISTSIEVAEMVKYVDNSWHALKVVFGNEIGVLANALNINSHDVMNIFFEDKRLNISTAYLRPGFAFGGSCLPKDLRALAHLARNKDLNLPVLNHIIDSNKMLVDRGVDWVLRQSKKRIAILGISFKSGTDDMRESPFVELVERLIGKGCEIRIYDPNVQLARLVGSNKEFLTRVIPHIADLMVPNISDAVEWAEAIVVSTNNPVYMAGLLAARSDQVILDFANLKPPDAIPAKTLAFLW